jgi:DNA (cytosine-5)-methyltransferase 1
MARILDGCCCAGGAARGYVNAGHEVHGVDLYPQPNYLRSGAASFTQADILEVLADRAYLASFDFAHVSPPCQRHSRISTCRPGLAGRYPALIPPARRLLIASGLPYVIENVEGAPLFAPVTLCAGMFGRELYRHRLFESGGWFTLATPPGPPEGMPGPRRECGWPHPVPASKAGHWQPGTVISIAGHVGNVALARKVMEIDWTTRQELAEAIPPYFTEWVGRQVPAQHAKPRE